MVSSRFFATYDRANPIPDYQRGYTSYTDNVRIRAAVSLGLLKQILALDGSHTRAAGYKISMPIP
jgi:hypothetical protein